MSTDQCQIKSASLIPWRLIMSANYAGIILEIHGCII